VGWGGWTRQRAARRAPAAAAAAVRAPTLALALTPRRAVVCGALADDGRRGLYEAIPLVPHQDPEALLQVSARRGLRRLKRASRAEEGFESVEGCHRDALGAWLRVIYVLKPRSPASRACRAQGRAPPIARPAWSAPAVRCRTLSVSGCGVCPAGRQARQTHAVPRGAALAVESFTVLAPRPWSRISLWNDFRRSKLARTIHNLSFYVEITGWGSFLPYDLFWENAPTLTYEQTDSMLQLCVCVQLCTQLCTLDRQSHLWRLGIHTLLVPA
jgi:hypothetical protein